MAGRGKPTVEDQENSERWLLTYADLITLLLAFFIVMYSMSRIDAKKFGRMQKQLSSVLRGGTTIFPEGEEFDGRGAGMLNLGELRLVQWRVQSKFIPRGKEIHPEDEAGPQLGEEAVTAEVNERGLVIHVKDHALFESGKADLKPEAVDVLTSIASELKNMANHICIEGHTDDVPINTPKFPSNWELSSARATNVVRYFVDKQGYYPDRISSRGFGEYRPMATNLTEDGRARNRRVDIVVLSQSLSTIEPRPKDFIANTIPPIRPEQRDLMDTLKRVSATQDRLEQ